MTQHKALKVAARALKAQTGMSYVEALRIVTEAAVASADTTSDPTSATNVPSGPQETPEDPERGGLVVAFTGDEGHDKSVSTLLFAAALRKATPPDDGEPLKVIVVDLCGTDGLIGSLLGMYVPTVANLTVATHWDEDTIRSAIVHSQDLDIDAILGPVRASITINAILYRTLIRHLRNMYDVILLDTPNLLHQPLAAQPAICEADGFVIVTGTAFPAVNRASKTLRVATTPTTEGGLGLNRDDIAVLFNPAIILDEDEQNRIERDLEVAILGRIPDEAHDVTAALHYARLPDLTTHPTLGPAYTQVVHALLHEPTLNADDIV